MKKIVLSIAISMLYGCGGGASTENIKPNVEDITCSIATKSYGDIAVPTTDIGNFVIPNTNRKLNNSIIRGMDLKDMDAWWSRPSTTTCTNKELYLQNTYIEDLNRVQKLGVEQIWVSNFGHWDDFSKSIWSISPDDYAIPNNVLKVIVQEAKKRNIKVFLNWQMNNSDKVHAWQSLETGDKLTKENLIKIMNSYEILIIEQAKFAQSIGLSGISASLGVFSFDIINTNPEFREIYVTKTIKIIDGIRAVYNGTIVYGDYESIIDERIISKIDRFKYMMWLGSIIPTSQLSVESLKRSVNRSIESFSARYNTALAGKYKNLPIEWKIYGQSTQDFHVNGVYMEDGFCFTPCLQYQLKVDYSIQAVAIEAALQAIASQQLFNNGTVSFPNYWHTDEVTPTKTATGNITFPNVSGSIRNKPAEALVKTWYSKN